MQIMSFTAACKHYFGYRQARLLASSWLRSRS